MVDNNQPVIRQRNASVLPITLTTFAVSSLLAVLLWNNLAPYNSTSTVVPVPAQPSPTIVVPATPVVTEWQTFALVNGDNLNQFLLRHHATRADIKAIMSIPSVRHSVRHLPAGGEVALKLNDQSELVGLKLPLKHGETITLSRTDNGFKRDTLANSTVEATKSTDIIPNTSPKPQEISSTTQFKDAVASGTVGFSLASALRRQGLPSSFAAQLNQIFAWKLNFSKDLHHSSHFNIVYQVEEHNGQRIDTGHILAAEITTDGKTYTALGFMNPKGQIHYYTPDGQSLEGSSFSRAPVHYDRVSSPFSLDRLQPILHIRRPHEGVDLAAPAGSSVHVVSDGVVKFIGRDAGYGNLVVVDHGHGISTRYAHLARFEPGVHVGSRVSQGETVGFVGSTGLATGPHLHFEYRINGRAVNPMTIDLPSGNYIAHNEKQAFYSESKVLEKELDGFKTNRLA